MDYSYIRKTYNLPFLKHRMAVRYEGREGMVVGVNGCYLRVRFEGMKGNVISNYHPTWNMVYLDDEGSELANFDQYPTR